MTSARFLTSLGFLAALLSGCQSCPTNQCCTPTCPPVQQCCKPCPKPEPCCKPCPKPEPCCKPCAPACPKPVVCEEKCRSTHSWFNFNANCCPKPCECPKSCDNGCGFKRCLNPDFGSLRCSSCGSLNLFGRGCCHSGCPSSAPASPCATPAQPVPAVPTPAPVTKTACNCPGTSPTMVPVSVQTAKPVTVTATQTGMTTAADLPRWFHSEDYRALIGELQHEAKTNTWQVQYTAAGTADRFGGIVTLTGLTPEVSSHLNSGMVVSIRGEVHDAGGPNPDFQVAQLDVMSR